MPIPFVGCEGCVQGAKNQLLEKNGVVMNPKRGKGERKLDCDSYKACLDLAAKEDWKTFNCESCSFFKHEMKEESTTPEKEESMRICEECGKNPTIQPSSPLCASCIGKKAWKNKKAKNEGSGEPKKKKIKYKDEPQKPQKGLDTALTIEFGKHVSILREVEKLAEEEVRPVDLQVIYILKKYLKNVHVT